MNGRRLVAILLLVAGVLFGIGTSYEAAERAEHSEPIEAGSENPSKESGERILGIDATSPAVIGAGIAMSFAAAASVRFVRRRPVDLAVGAFAAGFGALDLAEAVQGIREDEVTIGILALVIAALHLWAAWSASQLDDAPVVRGSGVAA